MAKLSYLFVTIAFCHIFSAFSDVAYSNSSHFGDELKNLLVDDDLLDDFSPRLQNLCGEESSTFWLGDDCLVRFSKEDLIPTKDNGIFESDACGDDEWIMIIFQEGENLPSNAVRVNTITEDWVELVPMPSLQPEGCMYTTIHETDVDTAKIKEYLLESTNGTTIPATSDHDNIFYHSNDEGASRNLFFDNSTQLNSRNLATCSSYRRIRLDIRFDSAFCQKYGSGRSSGALNRINVIINRMNIMYKKYPLCFEVSVCNHQGYCAASGDKHLALIQNSGSVCDGNGLLQNFKTKYQPRPQTGCDAMHLFYASTKFSGGTIGCAYIRAMCNSEAYAVNYVGFNNLVSMQALLVAHELGHNLAADHVSGSNQYIMEPYIGSYKEVFKSGSITAMRSYVNTLNPPTCTYAGGPSRLLWADFERGSWGPFRDGGWNSLIFKRFGFKSKSSLMLRGGTRSSKSISVLKNIEGFSSLRLVFFFNTRGVAIGERFDVAYNLGDGWKQMKVYERGIDTFTANWKWYKGRGNIDAGGKTQIQLKFQSYFSNTKKKVFIDKVRLIGYP